MLKQIFKVVAFALLLPFNSFAGIISITDPSSVNASSQYLNYSPEFVIDGELPVAYSSTHAWNAGGYTGWLQIDLGDIYTIDLVELYLTTGNHFNILVGNGTTWSLLNNTLQETAPYAIPGSAQHVYDWYNVMSDNEVSGQFLRYEVVSGGGHWAHLGEIQISGTLVTNEPDIIPASAPSIMVLFGIGVLGLRLYRPQRT